MAKAAPRQATTALTRTTRRRTGGSSPSARRSAPVSKAAKARHDAAANGTASGRQLVIVESPAKAKTINKYLGPGFVVLPSVGHVRDLPSRNPKGVKSPVPGVDLEHDFRPTYEILEGKSKVIGDLKRAARTASAVWFATDPDREGEAIAWHVAEELGIPPEQARRVMFSEITRGEIQRAFANPHPINMDRVNAQQARRILDRIVGYQVSPLLWKKVARGLSAGRVQSVAVRLIVEREREIQAFVPDEYWTIESVFSPSPAEAGRQAEELARVLDASGPEPSRRELAQWLTARGCFTAELVQVGDERFELASDTATRRPEDGEARARRALEIARAAGLRDAALSVRTDPRGRGPAQTIYTIRGRPDPATPYAVTGVETRRTTTRPPAPFITSTLQQAGSNRLGFSAKRTMGAAQALYQGVEIPGEGPVALITYMRTDSTHISDEALAMVREHIARTYGQRYLPERPNVYTSSNKDAQEAHEAIRPTSMAFPPERVRPHLSPDLFRVYELIWDRFVACQMTPAQWDATAVTIRGGADPQRPLTFRATGRTLVFDGFYAQTGLPGGDDEATLPRLAEAQPLAPIHIDPEQKFTSPPPRYTEASLIRTLEAEGIGRPSTYASIISVIQDRKYVEQIDRRFYATDLGMAVTDKLVEAFPDLMDLGYTREMESQLDRVEDEHLDWVQMLRNFYRPFSTRLKDVEASLTHAKAVTTPAPDEYRCERCGSGLVYRLGRSGRFLSCARYPQCDYACPCDREGRPQPIRHTQVACPRCGAPMDRRTGRFGPFLSCSRYGDKQNPCDGILRFDKKGRVTAPSPAPFSPEPPIPCPKCQAPTHLRPGRYGPWLGCSRFPKCRGRGDFKALDDATRQKLLQALEAHRAAHPVPIVRLLDGTPLTGADGKPLPDAPRLDTDEPRDATEGSLEDVADQIGL
jgi:DNA topoisomerase-1